MVLKKLSDVSVADKRVLLRVDFNVPLHNGVIKDNTRIVAALPTIEEILSQQPQKIVIMTHLGRPKGERIPELSVQPLVAELSKLLGIAVDYAEDCIGPRVESVLQSSTAKVVLLENVRYYKEETSNDSEFSAQLAAHGDIFINDAFGTVHRAHASTEGVAHLLPSAAGLLIEKEVSFLQPIITSPVRPLVAIVGGAKISTKFSILSSLLQKVDTLVIGGAMAYTFLASQGIGIGDSLFEKDQLADAAKLLNSVENNPNLKILLPVDHVVTKTDGDKTDTTTTTGLEIPRGYQAMDIGAESITKIEKEIANAASIFWNGPMGVFEMPQFATGTKKVAQAMAVSNATTVVGGGDSVAAINTFGLFDAFNHVSTGGGASMEFVEGKQLPGLSVLTTQ